MECCLKSGNVQADVQASAGDRRRVVYPAPHGPNDNSDREKADLRRVGDARA